ncbi:MAG: hypothetical protein EKK55_25060 [Rhodocyclaceae bacterium]|nr:MAG: hypothetical protein EKK55_25060 [Rhodocyclaceae bacterium]
MPSAAAAPAFTYLPTGFDALNGALGGGLVVGRIIEVFGHRHTWKTGLALHAACAVARRRSVAVMNVDDMVDEQGRRPGERLAGAMLDAGVDQRRVHLDSASNAYETVFANIEATVRARRTSLVVVDSVNGLAPLFGDPLPGWFARQAELQRVEAAMLAALRKICGAAHSTGTTVLFCRTTGIEGYMGAVTREALGPLGNALKVYASVRMEVRRVRRGVAKVRVVKNQCGPRFSEAEVFVAGVEPEPADELD